jgi:dethiobiotin synthetase
MVPLNDNFLMIDLIKQFNAKVILVSKTTWAVSIIPCYHYMPLKKYNIPVMGIVFNGPKDIYSKTYILNYSVLPNLGRSRCMKTG